MFTTGSLEFVFKTHTMILHMATTYLQGSSHQCPTGITVCQRWVGMKWKIIHSQHGSYVPGYNVCDCCWGTLSSHQSYSMAISLGAKIVIDRLCQRNSKNNQPKAPLSTQPCSSGCYHSFSQVPQWRQNTDSNIFILWKFLVLVNGSYLSSKCMSKQKYDKTLGSQVNQSPVLGVMIFNLDIYFASRRQINVSSLIFEIRSFKRKETKISIYFFLWLNSTF